MKYGGILVAGPRWSNNRNQPDEDGAPSQNEVRQLVLGSPADTSTYGHRKVVWEGNGVKDKKEEHYSGGDVDRLQPCQTDGYLMVDDLVQTFSG